jgi:hypothetical protein
MGFIQKKSLKNPQILLFLISKNFIISALSVAQALSGKVINPYSKGGINNEQNRIS